MNLNSIKTHLRSYSIYDRRRTTVHHAFASAIAPASEFDEMRLREAMASLNQADAAKLPCVYCGQAAETWDHLTALVRESEVFGYGHQTGNLVPACRNCNSRKGNRSWRDFVANLPLAPTARESLTQTLDAYQARFASPINVSAWRAACSDDWAEFDRLRSEVLGLMQKADAVAARTREAFPDVSESV